MTTRSVVAGLVAIVATLGNAPSASAAKPCEWQEPKGESVVRGESPTGGQESTEFYPDGSYAVTRCDADGRLEVSERVSRIRLADRDELNVTSRTTRQGRVFVHIDYTMGMPFNDPEGPHAGVGEPPPSPVRGASMRPTVVGPGNRNLPRPTPGRPVRRALNHGARSADHGTDDTCSNSQYTFNGAGGSAAPWSARGYGYHARVTSMPHGETDRVDITRGHHAWDYTINSCSLGDATNFVSDYLGTTSTTVHTYNDGVNVVDFGTLTVFNSPSRTIAVTVTFISGGRTIATDQRYEQPPAMPEGTYAWSNNAAANTFDVWNLASHESGHSLGLHHALSSHWWLTMSEYALFGSVRLRDLGLGDVLGLRALYP